MNQIKIDLSRHLGTIDRNIFGGFMEHLERCIYNGVYEPNSPLADEQGLRSDVIAALRRLSLSVVRYPGGNFASGYHWQDGIGPVEERPSRFDMAWKVVENNHFGTNEFIQLCRKLQADPYLVVNCGDGNMREARDWVEYCNGTQPTTLVKLRQKHGFEAPHAVKYWGIGNEVDVARQVGTKTAAEYARAFLEYSKVMRWTDPSIKLIASATSSWKLPFVDHVRLLIEQAANFIDYLSIHWYVGNRTDDFSTYMATSELIEERLSAYEGLIRALRLQYKIKRPIPLAVGEWNVWYRTQPDYITELDRLEEVYDLQDALVIALQLNAFIRHAASVRMANLSQLVNVIAPIMTRPDGLVLQTTYYPFELYSRTCGSTALDVFWQGDTFSTADYTGVRALDVSATLEETTKALSLYVVNRSETQPLEANIALDSGYFADNARAYIVNGPHIKATNTFEYPYCVGVSERTIPAQRKELTYTFEPHSVTALVCQLE